MSTMVRMGRESWECSAVGGDLRVVAGIVGSRRPLLRAEDVDDRSEAPDVAYDVVGEPPNAPGR
jgi:hypothetical protein